MRALIVDDERKGRETLEYFIQEFFPEVEIVALCEDIKAAAEVISNRKPDVVFLDVNMPKGSGFDLFYSTDLSDTLVVFVTAHAEHAVEAFKVDAFDYLLKPVSLAGITKVMDKLRRRLLPEKCTKALTRIQLKTASAVRVLNVSEIIYVISEGNYSTVYLICGEKILISKNLKKMQETYFMSFPFVRINQSTLVNASQVKEYNSNHVIMKDETQLRLSKNNAEEFFAMMNDL